MKSDQYPEQQLISELNYTDTRKEHLKQLSDYYGNVLEKYSGKYDNYLTNSNSNSIADNEDADLEINEKGEITGLNKHLISITNELNNLVMSDAQNILVQQNKINEEKKIISDNDDIINKLELKLNSKDKNNKYNVESLDEISKSNNNNNKNTILYIIINVILLVIIIIGLVNTKSL